MKFIDFFARGLITISNGENVNELRLNKNIYNGVVMTNKSLSMQTKEKPIICAIDLEQEIIEALQAKGLHCFSGTLGSEVKVPNLRKGDEHPCLPNYNLPPNLHEYDIVVVDLQAQELIEYIKSEHTYSSFKGNEQTFLLSSYPKTIFDPRPFSSHILGRDLKYFVAKKEIIIIVFCSAEEVSNYYPIMISRNGIYHQNQKQYSLYEFILKDEFSQKLWQSYNKMGKNVVVADTWQYLKPFLQRYSKSFIYEIVFQHPQSLQLDEKKWIDRGNFVPLLLNSEHEVVGFADYLFKPSAVFAFPQLKDRKKEFLLELIDEILPELFPKIFPYSDQFSWLKSPKYLLPNQANLLKKKEQNENEYKRALAEIEEEIQKNQLEYQFLHDLITETGESLVKSIESFFLWLGFENIINMDETNPEIKEEDIQISLKNGLLVMEIKGIGGTSKDSECSQISKIKYRRARERNSFDVFALYIVNHQRFIPPTERKNPPFNENQIADAQSDERGLLTTYELFKLYSNIEQGFVTKEDARFSLLEYGLVQFKPSKAHFVGCPLEVHHKGKVVIVNIDNIPIQKGASIIVCNDDSWFRAEILEIQLNDKTVESISEGEIGVRLSIGVLKTSELWLEDTSIKSLSR